MAFFDLVVLLFGDGLLCCGNGGGLLVVEGYDAVGLGGDLGDVVFYGVGADDGDVCVDGLHGWHYLVRLYGLELSVGLLLFWFFVRFCGLDVRIKNEET